jgi:hypothetical protein
MRESLAVANLMADFEVLAINLRFGIARGCEQ